MLLSSGFQFNILTQNDFSSFKMQFKVYEGPKSLRFYRNLHWDTDGRGGPKESPLRICKL